MKHLIAFLIFGAMPLAGYAQFFEKTIQSTAWMNPLSVAPLANGQGWVVAGSAGNAGAFQKAYLAWIAPDGKIIQEKYPYLNGERSEISGICSLPGGDLLLLGRAQQCDVSGGAFIRRITATGSLLWQNTTAGFQSYAYPGGSKLYLFDYQDIICIDTENGAILWQSKQAPFLLALAAAVLPDSVSFALAGYTGLHLLHAAAAPGQFTHEVIWPDTVFQSVYAAPNGQVLAITQAGQLVRQQGTDLIPVPVPAAFTPSFARGDEQGWWFSGIQHDQAVLLRYTYQFDSVATIPVGSGNLEPAMFLTDQKQAFIAGYEKNGEGYFSSYKFHSANGSQGLWLKKIGLDGQQTSPAFDIGVKDIIMGEPVNITDGCTWGFQCENGTNKTFTFPKVHVIVTNSGTLPIQQFYLNARFDPCGCGDICSESFQVHEVKTATLAPGESQSFTLSNVVAPAQYSDSFRLCFWTSAPDGEPDAHPENDLFCASVVVATNSPAESLVRLYPSPADDHLYIEYPGDHVSGTMRYQILNAAGQFILENEVPTERLASRIDVSGLPAGFYIFQTAMARGRFIKN